MMTSFFSDKILLNNETAAALYQDVARDLPIFDYHCHLNPRAICEDVTYDNIGQLWLEGDHYKWRLMRANGVPEELVTGNAPWKEKFFAFASAMPMMAGSPIYTWAHLELKTVFGLTMPINADTAQEIWDKTSAIMADGQITARSLIRRFGVEAICTTDDPADTLEYHRRLRDEGYFPHVTPTFRPDAAVCGLLRPDFAAYCEKISAVSGLPTDTFDGWLAALIQRMDAFEEAGCFMSDISLADLQPCDGTREKAEAAFLAARTGGTVSASDAAAYEDYMLRFCAGQYHARGWVMQLHLSALRNNNHRLFAITGPDSGIDSVGPAASVRSFGRLLDRLELDDALPKTIVYTLNPNAYYELASMLGNFQGGTPNRLELGAAWWFCDHLEGIREQLTLTADLGLLGRFTGMLTDSRSFTSYARHDYFRRILCSLVGEWVEAGLYDPAEAPALIRRVCIENARSYFLSR